MASSACLHSSLFELICVRCGTNVSDNSILPFGFMSPGLTLTRAEANRIRDEQTQNLLAKKKLILVLDLDNTLLNTSSASELTPDEMYLLDGEITSKNFSGLVQLRPSVHEFLEQVSSMFELYVYTLSYRDYAKQMVELLDPDNKNYFDSKLIAREDSVDRRRKSLDLVLGQERAILIMDDRKDVWPTNNANLIQVHPYHYFSASQPDTKTKSLAEKKCDENEYIMASYLTLLKQIHTRFFDDVTKNEVKVSDRDVRDVLKNVRVEILGGCKILLRHFPPMQKKELGKMAEKMGAICSGKLDSSVTHLVALGKKTGKEEILWAKRKNKCLVDQRWIRDCYELWRRIPEKSYTLVEQNVNNQ